MSPTLILTFSYFVFSSNKLCRPVTVTLAMVMQVSIVVRMVAGSITDEVCQKLCEREREMDEESIEV